MEPFEFLLIAGTNIFGIYALFKIGQALYYFVKNKMSKKEEL